MLVFPGAVMDDLRQRFSRRSLALLASAGIERYCQTASTSVGDYADLRGEE
jgi:hypothetical protein